MQLRDRFYRDPELNESGFLYRSVLSSICLPYTPSPNTWYYSFGNSNRTHGKQIGDSPGRQRKLDSDLNSVRVPWFLYTTISLLKGLGLDLRQVDCVNAEGALKWEKNESERSKSTFT